MIGFKFSCAELKRLQCWGWGQMLLLCSHPGLSSLRCERKACWRWSVSLYPGDSPWEYYFKTISSWKGGTSSELNGQEWVLAVPGLVPEHAFPSHRWCLVCAWTTLQSSRQTKSRAAWIPHLGCLMRLREKQSCSGPGCPSLWNTREHTIVVRRAETTGEASHPPPQHKLPSFHPDGGWRQRQTPAPGCILWTPWVWDRHP